MTTGAHTTITVEARDAASGVFQRMGREMQELSQRATTMQRATRGLNFVLGVAGIGSVTFLAANAIRNTVGSMLDAQRSATSLQTRMILMGFSIDQARSATQNLNANLSLTAMAGMRGLSDEAVNLFGLLSGQSKTFIDLAEGMSDASGGALSVAEAMNEIAKAREELTDPEFSQWVARQGEAIQAWQESLTNAQRGFMLLGDAFEFIKERFGEWVNFMASGGDGALETIITSWGSFSENLQVWGENTILNLWIRMSEAWKVLHNWWATVALPFLQKAWDFIWKAITGDVPQFFINLQTALVENWNTIKGWWSNIALPAIKDAINAIDWFELGKSIITGLGQGLISMLGWLAEQAQRVAQSIRNAFSDLIGHSPSALGLSIGEGLGLGIQAGFARSAGGSGLRIQAPLVVQMGNQTFATAVVEVMGDQLNLREPGLGMA